jgi:hypothetical protein
MSIILQKMSEFNPFSIKDPEKTAIEITDKLTADHKNPIIILGGTNTIVVGIQNNDKSAVDSLNEFFVAEKRKNEVQRKAIEYANNAVEMFLEAYKKNQQTKIVKKQPAKSKTKTKQKK